MPVEANELIAGLPPWGQALYAVVTAVGVAGYGILLYMRNRLAEKEREDDHFDAGELLDASPVKRFFENIEEIAINAKLQTEAARVVSAGVTAYAKLVEDGYDELRIYKAVNEALKVERAARGAPPPGGWGS